jgi:TonB family protein
MMDARPGSAPSWLTGRLHFIGTASVIARLPAMQHAASPAAPGPSMRPHGSRSLSWAVAVSVAVHAAALAWVTGGGGAYQPAAHVPGALRPAEKLAVSLAVDSPFQPTLLVPMPRADHGRLLPLPLQRPLPDLPAARPKLPAGTPAGAGGIDATLLGDRDRLGEVLLGRELTQFPVELGNVPRMDGPIRARYPAAALRDGREANVVVWVVVDASGKADNIIVVEGVPEFSNEVIEAVQAARFVPAHDNLQAIPYPIALEFRFVLGSSDTDARAAAAR